MMRATMSTFIVRVWVPDRSRSKVSLSPGLRGVVVSVATAERRRFMSADGLIAAIGELEAGLIRHQGAMATGCPGTSGPDQAESKS